MLIQNRQTGREFYLLVWDKLRAGHELEPLESLLAAVIAQHPEYHSLLADKPAALAHEYPPEAGQVNPFLHMSLHVALHEQLGADRPPGIADIYRRCLRSRTDPHAVEHRMMDCLAECLWRAQQSRVLPDEEAYLECLRRLL